MLAWAVAVLHGAAVVFMLTGALAALRWPRVLLLHVPVGLAILAVNLAGADCPLTELELWLRERAGAPSYDGGFLGTTCSRRSASRCARAAIRPCARKPSA